MGVNARDLSLWEYTALVAGWNAEVSAESGRASVPAPSPDRVERAMAKIPAAAFGGPH